MLRLWTGQLRNHGSIPSGGRFLHNIQTNAGADPSSNWLGARDCLQGWSG